MFCTGAESGRRKKSKPVALDARLNLAAEKSQSPADPLDAFIAAMCSDLQKERQDRFDEIRTQRRPRKTSKGYPPEVFFRGTVFEDVFCGRDKGKKRASKELEEEDPKFAQYYLEMFEEAEGDEDNAPAFENLQNLIISDKTEDWLNRKSRSNVNVRTWLRTLREKEDVDMMPGSSSPATSDGSDEQLATSKSEGSGSGEELVTSDDDCCIIEETPTPAVIQAPVPVTCSRSEETIIVQSQEVAVNAASSEPGTSDPEGSSGKENIPVPMQQFEHRQVARMHSAPYKHKEPEEVIDLSSDSDIEAEEVQVQTAKAYEEIITIDSD